ncbi:MAG: Fe-S cluster assembly sulfur transfer protein SufU [Thermodesulfobacteriota bacterium]
MSAIEDLYREIILDHYSSPRNRGELGPPALRIEGANPLCGDELVLYLEEKNGQIQQVKINTKGCSISQASASLMTEAITGKKIEEVRKIIENFKNMMLKENSFNPTIDLGDLEVLEGVKKYPVRIKCALLAWNTLIEGLKALQNHKKPEPVVME